ncbi:DEAD/DEAH box helicase [Oxalobacteraceae sp. CFBP 8755]|nr:DEAD/DEAH box helicase [Oxalobacteraceae sp. CFBP 8755]
MKPEKNSRLVLNLTRATSKSYEFGISGDHSEDLGDINPASLFILTIGILGDFASNILEGGTNDKESNEALHFCARYFDAFVGARFHGALPADVILLAAASYYLAKRPGSSYVLAKQIELVKSHDGVELILKWILKAEWSYRIEPKGLFSSETVELCHLLGEYFTLGNIDVERISEKFKNLRRIVYASGSSKQLLFVDVSFAITTARLEASSWKLLPTFTDTSLEAWQKTLGGTQFPKELWPSQILLGEAGIFKGSSGIVQMPTSAGKTRSLEIIIRSAFLSGRARMAVIVAPFRALCHEVSNTLNEAFKREDVRVNEISEALQIDLADSLAAIFGEQNKIKNILVFTPEKLLYVLRQEPEIAKHIGLLLYDEAHQFDSGPRGIVYELLLTEIKEIIPPNAQTVLVSAVIKNSLPVAHWLMGKESIVVDGTSLFPTSRSVAFASWSKELGNLVFFDSESYHQADYALSSVIEQKTLRKNRNEKLKFFPSKTTDTCNDVALYLGLKAVQNGATAIFCGLKTTAENLAERLVDIYSRDYEGPPPVNFSTRSQVLAMAKIIGENFGTNSKQYLAGCLGAFVHHGNTPSGIRAAIEYGMQNNHLKFVICTSTLAQGVNLPIRYLIVSSIYQAGERIKNRDFLNLVGRAGRAGMHTEGLVIFSDPEVFDKRNANSYWFDASTSLMQPSKSEDTSSSLLDLISPFHNASKKRFLSLDFSILAQLLVAEKSVQEAWSQEMQRKFYRLKFDSKNLMLQLNRKKRLLVAIETFLMSNRGAQTSEQFKEHCEKLATSSLAYAMGSEKQKQDLITLFQVLAENVEQIVPNHTKQLIYSKTLLGSATAKYIEIWVEKNRQDLLSLKDVQEWLSACWPLFVTQLEGNFFHTVLPEGIALAITSKWLNGESYGSILNYVKEIKGTKQWGDSKRRAITETDVMDFLENTLKFDCALLVSAIVQFLFGHDARVNESALTLLDFQKRLKHGLKNMLAVRFFEHGFSDRVLSQKLSDDIEAFDVTNTSMIELLNTHRERLSVITRDYPSYFSRPLEVQ